VKTAKDLELVSPLKIMSRGYAYTTDADDQLVKSVGDIKVGQAIKVNFNDGFAHAKIEEIINE
jgi:exodeoxyribonuclease VII large subunit